MAEEGLPGDEEVLDVGAVADVPHRVEVSLQPGRTQDPEGQQHGLVGWMGGTPSMVYKVKHVNLDIVPL